MVTTGFDYVKSRPLIVDWMMSLNNEKDLNTCNKDADCLVEDERCGVLVHSAKD